MDNNAEPIITIKVKKHPLHKKKLIIRPKTPINEVVMPINEVTTINEVTINEVTINEVTINEVIPINEVTIEQQINQYISQLNNQEKIVLKIATEHLKSSFDIEKSIGFKNWQKKL